MSDFSPGYIILFNGITDALEAMEKNNYGEAKEILITAHQQAEDIWLDDLDDELN